LLTGRVRVWACAALLLFGKDAGAQYAIVARSPSPEVLAQRVAVSLTDPPKVWLALRLAGGTEAVALVLAVAKDEEVRPTDSAWFAALEAATAVRVLAPEGAASLECKVSAPAWHDTREAWPEALARLSKIDRFDDVDAFSAYGEARGLELEDVRAKFESMPRESEIVALSFDCEPTESGCVVSAHFETRPQDEFMLPLLGSERGVASTIWAFSDSMLDLGARTASLSAVTPVTWHAAGSQSDYAAARSALLREEQDAWLLENASPETFGNGITVDEERRIPSLIASYEASEFDELASLDRAPEWILRWSVHATPSTAELAWRDGEQASVWPVHRWAKLDATGCVTPPPPRDPDPSGDDDSGGPCYLCTPDPESGSEHPEAVSGCSGSSSGSSEGCTADTSQSGDDGCSGDTSETSDNGCSSDTSESNDSDCSGDTSERDDGDCSGDSSESSDSSCSGDTSENGDSGCSGDSSGSESGCSGDTADSGTGCSGSTAATARPANQSSARRRWKGGPMISTYSACALILPLRRRRRRK
jgi:hypothetical protein